MGPSNDDESETFQEGVTPVQVFHSPALDPSTTEPRLRLGRPTDSMTEEPNPFEGDRPLPKGPDTWLFRAIGVAVILLAVFIIRRPVLIVAPLVGVGLVMIVGWRRKSRG
jgi:hypothetical protein